MDIVCSVDKAVEQVETGDTVGVGGFVAVGLPEYLLEALGTRYNETGSPGDLTLYHPAAEGDRQGEESRISPVTGCSNASSEATGDSFRS